MSMVIIGGGPAGLMAAERLSAAGHPVAVYEAMPTVGRKFMLAGKSGLNLTHDEDYAIFATRFGAANAVVRPALDAFPPKALRDFAAELGSETFVGSSGRVFPRHMKASPMLRAWLRRLDARGVRFHVRHRWTGWTDDGYLRFSTPDGEIHVAATATLLALGGASWPRLGSDGGWVGLLADKGVAIAPLKPANCGFDVDWSPVFAERNAGLPLKTVVATVGGVSIPGECVVTRAGFEGSLIYAHAAALRDQLERGETATIHFDLLPGRSVERIAADLRRQDAKQSFSNRLRKATGIDGVKAGLVRECLDEATRADPVRLAAALKALPVTVTTTRPIAEAISSAGGIRLDAIGPDYQLTALPGVFAAGEMLDWEAPTGGYLLTACFATGAVAADGMMAATAPNAVA